MTLPHIPSLPTVFGGREGVGGGLLNGKEIEVIPAGQMTNLIACRRESMKKK
jgi:hypothetical protein